ncbi:hypothetical protein Nmel_007878 [Mimus melanotis]
MKGCFDYTSDTQHFPANIHSGSMSIKPTDACGAPRSDEMLRTTTALDSTAVFVGQCFNGDDGKEILHTSWLLREKVDSEPDDWKATRTGRNTFTRMG